MTEQWNAADYHRQSAAQTVWAMELSRKLNLPTAARLLDLGCGTGRMAAGFAELLTAGAVVGIDASADMIEFAKHAYAGYPNLSFYQMDARTFELGRTFDVIFSNAVLHWVADHRAVLAQVRKHLQPGGRVLFQMGGRGNAAAVLATLDELTARPEWREYFTAPVMPYSFYGVDEYEAWLAAAHLRPERLQLIAKDMQHAGADGLKGWLRTTWFPYTNRVPADQQERFLDELTSAYLARNPLDEQGLAHVPMMRLEVEAVAE